jgi:hypothetical protein
MAAAVFGVGQRSLAHLKCLPAVCRRTYVHSHFLKSRRLVTHKQLHRCVVTKTEAAAGAASGSQGESSGSQGTGIFSSFWKWLTTDGGCNKVMAMEEKLERDALLQRIQDMYFAKPPVTPDLEFYREVFQTLIKFNDRCGFTVLAVSFCSGVYICVPGYFRRCLEV